MLYTFGIDYKHEDKLFYEKDKYVLPDFTIKHDGITYYWEHLGLIGVEDYDERWLEKRMVYKNYFPNQLIITYEDVLLSKNVKMKIEQIKNK